MFIIAKLKTLGDIRLYSFEKSTKKEMFSMNYY